MNVPSNTNSFIFNGNCYLILEKKINGISPSFPVVCINTGVPYQWSELNGITDWRDVNFGEKCNHIVAGDDTAFSKLAPGDLFLFSGKDKRDALALRLSSNFDNEEAPSRVLRLGETAFYAVDLCKATPFFPEEKHFSSNIEIMKKWTVKLVSSPIKDIIGQ